MDSDTFDDLVKRLTERPLDRRAAHLSAPGSRRALLRLVTALPLAGILASLLTEEGEVAGRRKRRKTRNKQQSGDEKRNRKGQQKGQEKGKHKQGKDTKDRPAPAPGCTPTTCAAQGKNCGSIPDGCGHQIRCGPDSCGDGYSCTDNRCLCPDGTAVCEGSCCQSGQVCKNGDGPCCAPVDPCTGGICGAVVDNCGQDVNCAACPPPVIDSFTGTPRSIDQGGATPESATLSWSTTAATSCAIDHGIGPVDCNGNTTLTPGPDTTTTYTLTAVGAGGDSVTAPAIVDVQYCHSMRHPDDDCTTSNTQFCRSQSISPTSAADALAACEACYGPGQCASHGACGGVSRHIDDLHTFYGYVTFDQLDQLNAGTISPFYSCDSGSVRWAT